MEQLLARAQAASAGNVNSTMLSAAEAERMIDGIRKFEVEEVGTSKWLEQHDWIDKLNLQAHHNAQTHSDEFVLELFISLGKLDALIHNLLVIEIWKESLYPRLQTHLAQKVDPIISYTVLYNEAALANLLEVILFHEHACEVIDEDHLLELCDWGYRKLQYLNTEAYDAVAAKEQTVAAMMAMTPEEDLEQKRKELEFGTALAALTITRYLTDHCARLPMGLLSRIVRTNDTVMAVLPLLDNPPWLRQNKGKWERYSTNRWAALPPGGRLQLGQHDVQAWLTLNNLLVEPKCRAKYELDSFRKNNLLKLKRFMNELLFDQVPVLKDLQRVLDEMAMNIGPAAGEAASGSLLLEQIPGIRAALQHGKDWQLIAKNQRKEVFGSAAKAHAAKQLTEMLKNLDFLCDLQDPGSKDAPANAKQPTSVKVACWRKVTDKVKDIFEAWCDIALELDTTKPPDAVTVASTTGDAAVQGLRYRLQGVDIQSTRALPTRGKVVAMYGSTMAEALLDLPVVPVRDYDDAPAALWVTVGLLATDGIALQLKLKKAAKATERDKLEGEWFAYHVVGGALTVLQDGSSSQQ